MNQSKDVRNIQKKFKINKAEEILLTQRINKSGLTASEYIRQSVLHDNPVAVIDKANIIIPQLADISSLTNEKQLIFHIIARPFFLSFCLFFLKSVL